MTVNIADYILPLICAAFTLYQVYTINRYKKLNENTKSLVATVTHDLKTPTRAQINILKMLLKGEFGNLNPKQSEMIKLMCGSSTYISNLVSTILAKYEYESNIIKLNFSKFNLTESVNQICRENEYCATEKEQKIIFEAKFNTCFVTGDKLQIERVISNLVSNALIHGFKNSTIKINLVQNDENVNFSVTNRSYPICERDLKVIFDKFSRTNNSKYNPLSTGLGLYVSKKIIDMHGGKIYANSHKDGLCTFGFMIPSKEYQLAKLSV